MKFQLRLTFYLLLLVIVFASCKDERQLVWEENFENNQLNEEYWNFDQGDGCPHLCGWGNNERQFYTKKNHTLEDGKLKITTRLEDGTYTSTRITTKGKKEFQYGKIEIKAKLPLGKGLWPAFWMLGANIDEVGWPLCGEIDILEYVGREPESIFTTLHTADSHGNSSFGKPVTARFFGPRLTFQVERLGPLGEQSGAHPGSDRRQLFRHYLAAGEADLGMAVPQGRQHQPGPVAAVEHDRKVDLGMFGE